MDEKKLMIEYIKVENLNEYVNNPRDNEKAVEFVAESIKEFGFKNPIIIDQENVIVAGHTRLKASKVLGLKEVPCIRVHDLTEEQIKAFRLADNKTAEFAEWNEEKLQAELENLSQYMMEAMGFEFEDVSDEVEDLYTQKVQTPVYEPSGEKPSIESLMDTSKRDRLVSEIRDAELPEDLEAFLIDAANRHVVFSYKDIAEYYAHSSEEVQDLFEKSALVIIDYDKAIELGFVKLTSQLQQIMEDGESEYDEDM